MNLIVKCSTLLAARFGILQPRASEEEEQLDEDSREVVFEVVDAGFAAHLPPGDEEVQGGMILMKLEVRSREVTLKR